MKRTEFEIQKQLRGLNWMKMINPPIDLFGHENHIEIDCKIQLLTGKKTKEDFNKKDLRFKRAINETNRWMEKKSNNDLFDIKES